MKIDQQDVHIARFLTKNFVNVFVLRSISVPGANGLIQTSAYVNAPILDLHAAILSTSTVTNANVSVLPPGLHAAILSTLTMTNASASAPILDPHAAILNISTVINANVSVPILDQHAAIQSTLTVKNASASAPILDQNAASLRSSTLQHVSVNARLLHHHANHHPNTILTLVPVSVLHIHAQILSTLTIRHAAVSVVIDTPARRTRSLTKRIVNASAPGWRTVGHHRNSTWIRVSANAPVITRAHLIKFSTAKNADASAIETPDVVGIKPLTTIAVIVFAIVSALNRTSWTRKSAIVYATKSALGDISSIEIANVFL